MSDKTATLTVDDDASLEIANIGLGAFAPLTGFMCRAEYRSVLTDMRTEAGLPWPMPITLDLPHDQVSVAQSCSKLQLVTHAGVHLADLSVEDVFPVDPERDIRSIFGTNDRRHPGVRKEAGRSPFRVGGKIELEQRVESDYPKHDLTPSLTRKVFAERGWKTIAGFQTRNPPHRAHEYLQRVALEITDGLFVQPLIGWKKAGDFTPRAIMEAYTLLIEQFYPSERALLGVLRTPMRYAGPREAVFHAIIRRNYGCTHFIVGRDHAGVGDYYEKYEAQALAMSVVDLGITILPLAGPYYCKRCGSIATERSCRHRGDDIEEISGTRIRALIENGGAPEPGLMRPDIVECLRRLKGSDALFNTEASHEH